MQASLVSHYGKKPEQLAAYLNRLQQEISSLFSTAFTPYSMEQIHATIVGFEGYRKNNKIVNTNFKQLRLKTRLFKPDGLLSFLRSPNVPPFTIQIGGYAEFDNHGFLSKGKHPYLRSFSIQGSLAVAMGWPTDKSKVLDNFRRSFNKINILHKWHKSELDIDNDFYFVLGQVDVKSIDDQYIPKVEENIRHKMACSEPIKLEVDRSTLSIVCYSDTALPTKTSFEHAIDDFTFTSTDLLLCFEEL